ncbi:MAG: Holliday junction resolvase RuvX [Planctomycetota bacterium]|nr:Holliday junction resolvase RuvX [Planctomycetota bacterium]MCX8039018.1 Holliday junction resolvase RuvX [Planctomycetota bacterium]MDW8372731.1 Holliday junction resolvase RuvX [Planctomycetota bacterium]
MPVWVGVDYGRARIGLAVCDALELTARPLGWIARADDERAARAVAAIAQRHAAAGIVIGMPRLADGRYGDNARWVQRFRARLAQRTTLPIRFCDERDTTAEAIALLQESGRWPCADGWIDAEAAACILRRFLAQRALTRGAASSPDA